MKNTIYGLVALLASCATAPKTKDGWQLGVRETESGYVSVACVKGRNISLLYSQAEGRARTALARALEGKGNIDTTISHKPAEYEVVNDSLCARIEK